MTDIAHGYTLIDIDYLAKAAARAATGALDGLTRYQLAWSAIAEHLVTAEEPPTRWDLKKTGWQAINREVTACMHARGYRDGHAYNGPLSSPGYAVYWHQVGDEPATDRLIDHIAAEQIGDRFTLEEGRVVEALGRHDDHALAAASLGMGYGTFSSRLSEARAKFLRHWYAPDPAPPRRGHDKRRGTHPPRTHCRAGHELAGENLHIQRRKGGKVERICRACERARRRARKAGKAAAA
jgi:hypothetical protein